MKKIFQTTGIFLCLFAAMFFLRPIKAQAGGIWAEIKVQYIILENDGRWHLCATPTDEDYIGVSAKLTGPNNIVMENTITSIDSWQYGENGTRLSIGEHRFFLATEEDVSHMIPGRYTLTQFDCPKGYEYDDAMESEFPLYVTITKKNVDDYLAFVASSEGGEGIEYNILVPVKKIGTTSAVLQKPEQPKLSAGRDNLYVETQDYTGSYSTQFQFATKQNGSYRTLTTTKQTNIFYFQESRLKHGNTYYIRARYCKTVNGKQLYGAYSKPLKIKVAKSDVVKYSPVLSVAKGKGATRLKVSGAGGRNFGYKISYAEKKNGTYKEIAQTYYTDEVYLVGLDNHKVKTGKTYYFRVRFVEVQGKETFYSSYSKPKKIKVL